MCLAVSPGAFAQDGVAARESRALGPSSASEGRPVAAAPGAGLPTTLALGGVVCLAIGAAGVVRAIARKNGGLFASLSAGGRAPAGVMEILGRYPVGRGCTLVLLKLDRRVLLLSQSAGGRFGAGSAFTPLAEITDPEEVAAILVKSRDAAGDSMAERFRTMLGRHERGMETPGVSDGRRRSTSAAGDRVEVWDDRTGIPVIDLTHDQNGAAGTLRKRLASFGRAG
jgi:hypothetical protein